MGALLEPPEYAIRAKHRRSRKLSELGGALADALKGAAGAAGAAAVRLCEEGRALRRKVEAALVHLRREEIKEAERRRATAERRAAAKTTARGRRPAAETADAADERRRLAKARYERARCLRNSRSDPEFVWVPPCGYL